MIKFANKKCGGRAAGALCALACVSNVYAFEVDKAETHYQNHEFRVELALVLDAPIERVQAVLRDYANYPKLDSGILETQVLSRPDASSVVLYTKVRACSGFFCRSVKRVERVQESPFELSAVVKPEESEVVSGSTHTVLQSVNGRTRVLYETAVTPKFWVPSFIGRPLMLRTLRDASLELFRHVEARAKS